MIFEELLDRLLTQYRESPKLRTIIRSRLAQLAERAENLEQVPDFFELDTAVGDQLTILGKLLGWPRSHKVEREPPVFGFDAGGYTGPFSIAGMGQRGSNWFYYARGGSVTYTIDDDEVYRTFLRVRIYQYYGLNSHADLQEAVQQIWPNGWVPDFSNGRVVIAPFRAGSATGPEADKQRREATSDRGLLQLWLRVLPIAPGIRPYYHFDSETNVFGFGEGWGGLAYERPDVLLTAEDGEVLKFESGEAISLDEGIVPQPSIWLWPERIEKRGYL